MAFRSQMIVAILFFILGTLAFAFRHEVLGWIIIGLDFLWSLLINFVGGFF